MRIYNRALSAGEISADMTRPVAPGTQPPADGGPPNVAISAPPAEGATVSGTTPVSANASDDIGVVGVQFTLDGANLGAEDTSAPYSVSWDTTTASDGQHTLRAIARDAAGNSATSAAVAVTVSNATDGGPPNVAVSAPAEGATVSGTTPVSADASDDIGVVGVQFTLDGANLGAEDTGAPYSVSWDTTAVGNGPHTLRAIARDAAGNSATSAAVAVTVSNATDGGPPNVAVSAPAEGATVSGTTPVSANASDDIGVVGVQFTLDGANLGAEDTSAPYSVSWDTTAVGNGPHTLRAIARDAAGNSATSAAVAVTVSNASPPNAGLVAAYGFEETSGPAVTDSSGLNNAGTIINDAARTAAGKIGSAIDFDGVNDYVSVADANSLDLTTGMTLEAWVQLDTVSPWRTAIFKEKPGSVVYDLYATNASNSPQGEARFGSAIVQLGAPPALTAGVWTHLAVTYDGAALRVYRNGTQAATVARTGTIQTSTGALRIGGNLIWGEYTDGRIDEVRIYNRALSAGEISADMTRPVV